MSHVCVEHYRERMRARLLRVSLVVVATAMSMVAGGFLRVGATSKVAPFEPISVSFSSPEDGWVLGTLACAHDRRCLTMLETVNAGQSWFEVQLPAPLVKVIDHGDNDTAGHLDVHFANTEDGWVYGQEPATIHQGNQTYSGFTTTLWATHDGGTLWEPQRLAGMDSQGTVYDVESSNANVFVLAPTRKGPAEVESSPVGKNQWRKANHVALNGPAGGAQPSGSIVLAGGTGWLIFGNDRGAIGSAQLSKNGSWVSWRSPCAGVGHGYAVPAAANARDLVAVCGMAGFAYGMPKSAPRGAVIGSSWLYFSTNGGASFTAGGEIRPVKGNLSFGEFPGVLASPRPGVVLLSRYLGNAEQLVASYDKGGRWSVVYTGLVSYLSFMSPSEGVGLVNSQIGNQPEKMIMTFDGGRHWKSISF
jgi:hypothetical protein